MSRTLIVARIRPGTEKEVGRIYDASDASDLPLLVSEAAGGLDSLAQARRLIRRGTRAVLAGGTEAGVTPSALTCQATSDRLTATGQRARVLLLVRVPHERQQEFLAAYARVRYAVADGVPRHVRDQVCRSADDPEQWLITSEWEQLPAFLAWESSPEHWRLIRPLRACMTEAKSQRFLVLAETSGRVKGGVPPAHLPGSGEPLPDAADAPGLGEERCMSGAATLE